MNKILSKLLQLVQQCRSAYAPANTKKGWSTMTTAQQTNNRKFDVFKYAYGQMYRGFLESGKADKFVITNLHVREWKGILSYFKKKEYIVDYRLGETVETACELMVEGLDEENIPYPKYAEGVRNNLAKELAEKETLEAEVKPKRKARK